MPVAVRFAMLSVLLGAAAPAAAERVSNDVRSWGDSSLSWVRLQPTEDAGDHAASVVFVNSLTFGTPEQLTFNLEIEGLSVVVVFIQRPGNSPDTMTVVPPPGFMAEPESIDVQEGESGRIAVRHRPMS